MTVVAFKYQPDGQVEIYDENGSIQIPTSSENTADIMAAWQYMFDHTRSNPYGSNVGVLDLRSLTY